MRKAYKILAAKPLGKIPLRRPKHICKGSIQMAFGEIGCEGVAAVVV
jgi:hypothetical protein